MLSKRVLISLLILAGAVGGVAAADRDLLWGVVKVCVANHELTGGAFPCLEVDTTQGVARGFAVVRAPLGEASKPTALGSSELSTNDFPVSPSLGALRFHGGRCRSARCRLCTDRSVSRVG